MTSLTYLAESVPWILGGLVVGYLMGRSTVAVEAIADAVQDEGDAVSNKATTGKRRMRFTSNGVIAVVLIGLGIATAVQTYVQGEATARLTACQTAYANGFADALDARSKASSDAQDALDELLSTVAAIAPTPNGRDQYRAALEEYNAKRTEAKRTQAENPYPPAPRDVCKEP